VYNYLLFLTRCYGLLRIVLFKLYVFKPHHFSFVVCPSVLDDLPPLVAVASSPSCPDLLRVFNYIVKVSKIAAYLLSREVHVDFSGSNVDDCFRGVQGWPLLISTLILLRMIVVVVVVVDVVYILKYLRAVMA